MNLTHCEVCEKEFEVRAAGRLLTVGVMKATMGVHVCSETPMCEEEVIEPICIHCARGLAQPIEEIKRRYPKEYLLWYEHNKQHHWSIDLI